MKRTAAVGERARGMKELEPRVFVVDDDQSVRTSLANLLATEDYAVEIFASAAEYLARVPHPGPACLVLDVQLPGLDGLALQRQLTEEGRMEQIVFITGHGDIPMGIGAMKRGAVDFLPKPFRDDRTALRRGAGAGALCRGMPATRRGGGKPGAACEAHATRVRGLPVGDRRAAQQGDRRGTRRHASHDQDPSRPRDAENRSGFSGRTGEAGAEGGSRARAAWA